MSKALTDDVLLNLTTRLTWHTSPVFEQADIECVIFAFKFHRDPFSWLKSRQSLFENPDIVKITESVINEFSQKN